MHGGMERKERERESESERGREREFQIHSGLQIISCAELNILDGSFQLSIKIKLW